MKTNHICYILIFILTATAGCSLEKEVVFSGKTMGTTYSVKVIAGYLRDTQSLEKEIAERLGAIDQSMSIYIEGSEISRFNAGRSAKRFSVSDDFVQVFNIGLRLYNETEGAWDGTVGPLVNLWGFGSGGATNQVPLEKEIDARRQRVGFHLIRMEEGQYLVKKRDDLFLDLGSIAKGYGVDQAAALIREKGIDNFLVEIGGEVFASGLRKDGANWRIGINVPLKSASYNRVYKVVTLHNRAMATSGDYRNFFEIDGKMYSHVIDPRSGYPVANHVVSVSIIADTCTVADGLATAVMVMGAEKGLALVNGLETVEGLIIVKNPDGTLADHYSTNFPKGGRP